MDLIYLDLFFEKLSLKLFSKNQVGQIWFLVNFVLGFYCLYIKKSFEAYWEMK